MHTITDSNEPAGAASPIGKSVVGKYFDAKKAPGTRTNTMDNTLCKNEIPDKP